MYFVLEIYSYFDTWKPLKEETALKICFLYNTYIFQNIVYKMKFHAGFYKFHWLPSLKSYSLITCHVQSLKNTMISNDFSSILQSFLETFKKSQLQSEIFFLFNANGLFWYCGNFNWKRTCCDIRWHNYWLKPYIPFFLGHDNTNYVKCRQNVLLARVITYCFLVNCCMWLFSIIVWRIFMLGSPCCLQLLVN